jgi:DNA invertase Pin-like site-specific DNA recombinase
MPQHLGYIRVSTTQQTHEQQRDVLERLGVERIFEDKMSGATTERPGLQALLGHAREGDTITVVALDRLGRSLVQMIQTIDDLNSRGVVLRSVRESVDFSTPMGQVVAAIFLALAQYERTLISERAAAAREAARVRGRQTGRPRALTREQTELARRMRSNGEHITTIASTLGVSRATVYRAVADAAAA